MIYAVDMLAHRCLLCHGFERVNTSHLFESGARTLGRSQMYSRRSPHKWTQSARRINDTVDQQDVAMARR
jgi:hypothetical protein